jgi:hypothetical protein
MVKRQPRLTMKKRKCACKKSKTHCKVGRGYTICKLHKGGNFNRPQYPGIDKNAVVVNPLTESE